MKHNIISDMKTANNNQPYIEIIQEIMQEKDLSQRRFADIIGVNQTTVSQWLLGNKKPGYDNIKTICEKFDISPNAMFGLEI